nr:PQ-loop domain-containing transporter [Mycoplasmopsis primatum]
MNKVYEIFFVNGDKPISAWFIIISGFIAATLTTILGLPQAISLFKSKKTGSVKYYSYWMFFAGLIGWIFLGSFDPTQKVFILVIANIISGFIYIFTLWLTYRYSSDIRRQRSQWMVLSLSSILYLAMTAIASCALALGWKISNLLQSVIAQIIPIITTFAFLPQILKSFETKDYSGMSIGMVYVFTLSNIFWCIYWLSFIVNAGAQSQYLSAIIWQAISLGIYATQLILMLIQRYKNKKILKVKQESDEKKIF